jgi:hypothetical protein
MLERSFFLVGLLASLGACGGVDAIEIEPDDKGVNRTPPSWPEDGAKAPIPATPVVDAGTDAAQSASDAAVTDASAPDAGSDAGSDAAAPDAGP